MQFVVGEAEQAGGSFPVALRCGAARQGEDRIACREPVMQLLESAPRLNEVDIGGGGAAKWRWTQPRLATGSGVRLALELLSS